MAWYLVHLTRSSGKAYPIFLHISSSNEKKYIRTKPRISKAHPKHSPCHVTVLVSGLVQPCVALLMRLISAASLL